MNTRCATGMAAVVAALGLAGAAQAADIDGTAPGIPAVLNEPPPLPKEFAFTFSLPYGLGDEFPREPQEFDRMLRLLKGAGYNTVHCSYTDWRHELFKKHKMKMMVDVLAWKPPVEADVRRPHQRHKVKEMCRKVRRSDAIWGYNLWNERLDWCGGFQLLDAWVRMLRTWDPTHPVWVGTYRYLHCESYKTDPGCVAWYDYHWARGFDWNLGMLDFYRKIAPKRRSVLGKWLLIGDYNRNLYTLNMSIAHGVKVVLWFIGGPYNARQPDKAKRWNEDMHLVRIGRHVQPLYKLIGRMGLPYGVYSTPTRRTAQNQDKAPGIPKHCHPFPDDARLTIKQGEVLCGFFKLPDKSDVVCAANHNAWAWQGVVMAVRQEKGNPLVVWRFDRKAGGWQRLGALSVVNIAIPPADARVLRFQRDKSAAPAPPDKTDYDPAGSILNVGRSLRQKGLLAGDQPAAVYSTPTGRTVNNQDKEPGVPDGAKAFPADFWLRVKQGEALCGVFKLKDGAEAVCFANHNAHAWQGMLVVPKQVKDNPTVVHELDQKTGQWVKLGAWADVNFPLPPAGSAVFKFERAKK